MTNPRGMPPALQVLLLEGVHVSAVEILTNAGCIVSTLDRALSEEELVAAINRGTSPNTPVAGSPSANAVQVLGIRSKTQVTAQVIQQCPSLIAIGCFCIGTNQVDLVYANSRGIPVFNAPYANTRSVAELVISEIIALSRQLCDRSKEVHQGTWKKVAAGCYEIRGKTVGIVGYGHIGSQVGVLAEMLGMRVIFYDHQPKLAMGNNKSYPTLEAVLQEADFVTLHVPETDETKNMIAAPQLNQMKKGSYLLNLSRGTVVDVDALAQALKAKHLAGGAVDVYPTEPESNCKDFQTPLQGIDNVILTPHVGGSTVEAQQNIGREVAHVLSKFVVYGATTGAVNFPVVEPSTDLFKFHRVINIHRNVPGVLREINRVVAEVNGNIRRQILSTDDTIGYLVIDIDQEVSAAVHEAVKKLPFSIQDRVLS